MSDIVWGAWIDHDAEKNPGGPPGVSGDEMTMTEDREGFRYGMAIMVRDVDWAVDEDDDEDTIARYRLRADPPVYVKPEATEPAALTTALLSAIPDDVLIAEVVRRMGVK